MPSDEYVNASLASSMTSDIEGGLREGSESNPSMSSPWEKYLPHVDLAPSGSVEAHDEASFSEGNKLTGSWAEFNDTTALQAPQLSVRIKKINEDGPSNRAEVASQVFDSLRLFPRLTLFFFHMSISFTRCVSVFWCVC